MAALLDCRHCGSAGNNEHQTHRLQPFEGRSGRLVVLEDLEDEIPNHCQLRLPRIEQDWTNNSQILGAVEHRRSAIVLLSL